jgi:hypothetical protein
VLVRGLPGLLGCAWCVHHGHTVSHTLMRVNTLTQIPYMSSLTL